MTYAFYVSMVIVFSKVDILNRELKIKEALDLLAKYDKLAGYYCVWASIINFASCALLVVAFIYVRSIIQKQKEAVSN